jgi:hypothetical protein
MPNTPQRELTIYVERNKLPSYPIMQCVCVRPCVRPCVRRKTPSWYMRAVQPTLVGGGCGLGAEISSGGRRPPSPPQELEVRCAERSLTSSVLKLAGMKHDIAQFCLIFTYRALRAPNFWLLRRASGLWAYSIALFLSNVNLSNVNPRLPPGIENK